MSEQTADDQKDAQEPEAADNVRPIDRAKERLNAAAGGVRNAAADLGDRVQQASATVKEEARERTERARERARERFEQMKASDRYAKVQGGVQEGYDRVRKEAEYRMDDVNDFVRHKPGTAILVAAGAGFILGLMFRPRRYDD